MTMQIKSPKFWTKATSAGAGALLASGQVPDALLPLFSEGVYQALGGVLAGLMGLWLGKDHKKDRQAKTKKDPMGVLLVLLIPALLAGCAAQLTAAEKARAVGYELGQVYQDLHAQYQQLEQNLPKAGLQQLQVMAESMDRAKVLLTTYNDLVLAGLHEAEQTAKVKKEVQDLIADLVSGLTRLTLEYAMED